MAISQSYKAVFEEKLTSLGNPKANEWWYKAIRSAIVPPSKIAGYKNKMFVRADLMPHHIRITDVKVERLQDISDYECLKEGLKVSGNGRFYFQQMVAYKLSINKYFDTPREAFAYLIDEISGNGTWESNPWVFAYSFESVD